MIYANQMQRRSPTLEGFRLMLSRPALGLGEIAWRWSFGASAWLLILFAVREYLDTLPVRDGDLLLLRTRQPALISQAILDIVRGSSLRVVQTSLLLLLALSVAWIVISALGRAATLKTIVGHFRVGGVVSPAPFRSLLGIHFFRAVITLAGFGGAIAAFVMAGAVTPANNPSPGATLLVFLALMVMVLLAWALLNANLVLASVFAVVRGYDTFAATAAAFEMCGTRLGSLTASGAWFGVAHFAAFSIASTVVAFPLAFSSVLPLGVVFGGVLLVTLLYFAVVDYIYIGRLVAFVAILELLAPSPTDESPAPMSYSPPQIRTSDRVDPDELILSDVPV